MRITENFFDPLDYRTDQPQQISLHLVANDDGEDYVEISTSVMSPRIKASHLHILIGMLEALKKRANV